ncbi:MAG: hypothetical protein ABUK01_09415 [Leptospirales bacterium]
MNYRVCVNNEGYEPDLQKGKKYLLNPNAENLPEGFISVIDDSGEDYIYAAENFIPVPGGETKEDRLRN